jgi:branched-chain amino acid transport system ATP-binding protein
MAHQYIYTMQNLRRVHPPNKEVLKGIYLSFYPGAKIGVLGSNGAGKSTLLNTVCGILRPQGGSVLFEGQEISGRSPEEIVARGITQVPEGRRLFPLMTVRENLLVGAYRRKDARGIADDLERVLALFPRLRERAAQRAGTLSGGEQQMCAIGRGLMARPRLLLLDELSLGLAPIVLDVLADAIREVHRAGTSILLVEQDVAVACDIAQTGYVLENGRVALSGPTAQLRVDPHVARAYLGI